jgi:hypothetical protein
LIVWLIFLDPWFDFMIYAVQVCLCCFSPSMSSI